MLLKDKVAIVTGGSRGIGRAITLGFARDGAYVAFIYKSNHEAAEETKRLATEFNGKVDAYQACVTDYEAIERIVKQVKKKYGKIDILINNAGILKVGRIGFLNPLEWNDVIDVNLKGVLNCCHAVARIMMAQKSGRIVNISSVAAFRGFEGQAAYAASKAGVVAITQSLAKELGKYGIIVNGIAPGLVKTEMIKVLKKVNEEEDMANPKEIALLVCLLVSENAMLLQGQTISAFANM